MYQVLVVEDDVELRTTVSEALERNGYTVHQAGDGIEALELIKIQKIDLAMLDVNMPRLDGMATLKGIKEYDPSIIVIIMTAYSTIENAVKAIKEGAYNYLAKPIKHQAIVDMVQRALSAQAMVETMAFSAPIIKIEQGEFVGNSDGMKRIFTIIHRLAKVDTSVLIRGESGTGKELVARALHYNSPRKDQKLVAVNCSSIAESLFESELFGHEKGAFTGADQRQIGRFQFAEGGTLFLDEIGDLSAAMQVKLLRVLQERKFTPVGSNREIDMDVRVIAATNRNLEELIKQGSFREDLFYRLNVIPIFLPPLRDRADDIERLVGHFIAKFNVRHQKNIQSISPAAMEVLLKHNWPGNIRELENVIEHSFIVETTDKISANSMPSYIRRPVTNVSSRDNADVPEEEAGSAPEGLLDYHAFKEQFEKEFIIRALRAFNGRINQTALHAKIPKKTLLRKLQKYGIKADDYRAQT